MDVVTCERCNKSYPAVFRSDAEQGYGCATIRVGTIFIGHYGSEVADGTRYMLQEDHQAPNERLFCDICITEFIASGAIAEILEQEPEPNIEDDTQALIFSILSQDKGAKPPRQKK